MLREVWPGKLSGWKLVTNSGIATATQAGISFPPAEQELTHMQNELQHIGGSGSPIPFAVRLKYSLLARHPTCPLG